MLALLLPDAILLNDVLPRPKLRNQVPEYSDDIGAGESDLVGGVELTQSDSVVLECLIVDGHGEWDTALVSASVALSNRVRAVVNLA